MRKVLYIVLLLLGLVSCRETIVSNDPTLKLRFSHDVVLFDTVFTSMGSSTKRVMVYNPNENALCIEQVSMRDGKYFHINLDGEKREAQVIDMKIANEKLTAIDDGTIAGAWGSTNIDDEGNPTQRNVLIENGILKSYMIDRLGSRRMGMPMTGNSRRQSYSYEPTSRMTNTFIANGPDKNEDIIASIEYGLYAASMGGGSVNPVTGEFNFTSIFF